MAMAPAGHGPAEGFIHSSAFRLGGSFCSLGNAVRHCSGEKGWLPPELFNCTTVSFVDLKAMVGLHPGDVQEEGGFPGRRVMLVPGWAGPGDSTSVWGTAAAISSSLSRSHPASGSADSESPRPSPPPCHPPMTHGVILSPFFHLVSFSKWFLA